MGTADVLRTLKVFVDFIPEPAKTPVSTLLKISITICERVEQVSENVQAVAELEEQQAGISADVVNELRGVTKAQIDSGGWIPRLEQLTSVLKEVRDWVLKYPEDVKGDGKSVKAVAKAIARMWESPGKKKEIDALKAKLDKAREELKLQLDIATLVGVQRVTEILRQLMHFHDQTLVDRLKPVFSARYGAHESPGDCLPDTRLALRSDLRELLTADDGQRIVWLSGLAGTGKSTVARSICSDLNDTHDVVSFFIKRGTVNSERSKQKGTLQTLVYQLAQCIPQVLSAVVLAKDGVFSGRIHDQVNVLVRDPLSTFLPGARPVVIVLDAVDELDGTENECDIIPCFLSAIANAKVRVRVLVTSRGKPSDFLRLTYRAAHDTQRLQQDVVKAIWMHDYHPQDDIRAYLVAELERVAMERSLSDWPSSDQIKRLVSMSAQLFIFAATIIRWVDGPTAKFALSQLLKQSSVLMERTGPNTIFALYEYVSVHALDENIPQQLLGSALGKNPDDGKEGHALRLEVTLSILSTLRCLREPLTRDAFAQLWAGHLIAEPELYQGVVVIAGDLISRLSGVLFIWEPDSSITLLHASFGDFLDAPSSPYHVSSEGTHSELASKCVSIMLSTKDAYSMLLSGSLVYPLLHHQLGVLPWILDSDFLPVARYSFSQWISHAFNAPRTQSAQLLKQVRLPERAFWFAGVFLKPGDITLSRLQLTFDAIMMQDAETAYAFATAVYIYGDEASRLSSDLKSTALASFDMMWNVMSSVFPVCGITPSRSDGLDAMKEHGVLDLLLTVVLYFLDLWMVTRGCSELPHRFTNGRWWRKASEKPHSILRDILRDLHLPTTEPFQIASTWNVSYATAVDMSSLLNSDLPILMKWSSNFSTRIRDVYAVLNRFGHHMDMDRWEEEMEELKSIGEELEKWAEDFGCALRALKYEIIVKPYDEQFITALDRLNAGVVQKPVHERDGPDGVDWTLSVGHFLDADPPPRPEGQSQQVD